MSIAPNAPRVEDVVAGGALANLLFFLSDAVAVASLADGGRYVIVNDSFCALTGYERDELIGKTSTEIGLLDDASRQALMDNLDEMGRTRDQPVTIQRKDGTTRQVRTSSDQFAFADDMWAISISRDDSDRITEEEATRLRAVDAERSRMLDDLVVALDLERENLASQLRAVPILGLTAATARLKALRLGLGHDHAPTVDDLEQVEQFLEQEIETLRRVTGSIQPPDLEGGIAPALTDLCDRFAHESDLRADVRVQAGMSFSPLAAMSLYRIAQEALNNIVRHAEADRCWVSLEGHPDGATLSISDDGCGFDVDRVLLRGRHHVGLLLMKERAEMVGGRFEITSTPDEGTEIMVHLSFLMGGSVHT